MLYDGKRPQELSNEELEAAAVYCHRMKHWTAQVFERNDAAIQELSAEYASRNGYALDPDIEDLEPASRETN
jgi:hypothetical protein